MKALLINASPRREGNTHAALSEVAKQLSRNGVESEIVHIGTKPVRSCIACGQCQAKGLGRCVFDDDICNRISEKMATAHALVVGTPVYYGQPNGAALSLVQRMFFSAGHVFRDKPAAAIAMCRRGGATAALQTLMMPFQLMSMPIVTSQYWNIAYGMQPGEVGADAEGLQTMRTLADNLAHLLRRLEGAPAPKRDEVTYTNFIR